ncbi:hypothetical protein [Paraburkholderia nemoris]|uniref:hypothetical protein n=1 Tax=Paraburkholderia nemoris TaxID=2793076 RepID=UPI0038B82145
MAGFSIETLGRFALLDDKYGSDLERLVSLDEGVALFDVLESVPCPLCGTALDAHSHAAELSDAGPEQQRQAIRAEARKIEQLRRGLLVAISAESERRNALAQRTETARSMLHSAEALEKRVLTDTREEFSEDPSELALRRTELANTLRIFQDSRRLVLISSD